MTGAPFKDHFSGHSQDYRAFRPTYPLWLVHDYAILGKDENPAIESIAKIGVRYDGGPKQCIAVFTDEDLAERFIRQVGHPLCKAHPLADPLVQT